MGAGDTSEKTTIHSPPPIALLVNGPPWSCSDNQPNSQDGSCRIFRSQHLSDRRGKGAGMRRKAFSALECFNVCLCVSQKCGSAAARLHFMGKSVSHHCVLSGCQTLTGLVGCVCVRACVCGEQTLLVSESSSTGRGRVQIALEPPW